MVDLFETRTMLGILETIRPVQTFFLDTFFKVSTTFNTESVDIDIIKGKRKLAPFVHANSEAKLTERKGHITRNFKPPYIKPLRVTTAANLLKRQPGEVIYSANETPAVQASRQLGKDFAEMGEEITRRIEWMASQALQTGSVKAIGEGIDVLIDFHMEATHLPVLSGVFKWDVPATAKPIQDLKAWKRIVSKASGHSPTICLMGLAALDNFLLSDEVSGSAAKRGLFDMRKINIGQIDPQMLPGGVTFYGTITEIGLDIFTYEEWYVNDDDGIEYPLMHTDKVLLGNPRARAEILYGAIQNLDSTVTGAQFPSSWTTKNPSRRFAMIETAPLPTPIEIDAFLCATVQ